LCWQVDLRLDIKLSSGEVLQNMPAKRVRAVHPFGPDVNVVKDGWLGTVYKVPLPPSPHQRTRADLTIDFALWCPLHSSAP